MSTETILSIATCLLGGINIFQIVFLRYTKKKYEAEADVARAEADKARTEVKQGEMDLHQDQYDYVYSQLTKVQQDYNEMADRFRKSTKEYIDEINAKCNEIANLKGRVAYFKGLRCYRSSCGQRIYQSPTCENNCDKEK